MTKGVMTLDLERIAQRGDSLETLKALRQKLAKAIDSSNSGRDISSLARQLQIVMAQIDELENNAANTDSLLSDLIEKHASSAVRKRKIVGSVAYDDED